MMNMQRSPASRSLVRIFSLAAAALVALFSLTLLRMAWRTIEPGYVGIVFDKASHRVTNTLDPGWVFVNPFTQSITKYPISLQTLVMVQQTQEGQVQGDDSVKVGTRDGQTLYADVAVQYTVARDDAANLYQTWAGAPIARIEENLVRQALRSTLNDVASQYGWEEIYGARRVEYTQRVSEELRQRFGAKYVTFESLNLRGWHLPEQLQRVLAQKIAAQQAAEQQAFALRQAEIKAQQDRVAAEGQANALRAQAEGEADATTIRAAAQAEANRQLAQSLTEELIEYQQLQRWNGNLPVFNGGNTQPLVDVTSLLGANGVLTETAVVTPTTP